MKKELRKGYFVLAVVAGAALSPLAFALGANDGAPVGTAQGRAVLSVADLKLLLGIRERSPSAKTDSGFEDEMSGLYSLNLRLGRSDRTRLNKAIHVVENERQALAEKAKKDADQQKLALRKDRRAIQASRTGGRFDSDEALGKSLFENLLSEANADAAQKHRLSQFDSDHLVVLEFRESSGVRYVQSIRVGSNKLWTNHSVATTALAKR